VPEAENGTLVTEMLRGETKDAFHNEEAFEAFLTEYSASFGSFNRTAYKLFSAMFEEYRKYEDDFARQQRNDQISHKNDFKESFKVKSINKKSYERKEWARFIETDEELTDVQLCAIMAMGVRGADFTDPIRKAIFEYMPNRSTISEVINKTVNKDGGIRQVNRKYLILIWLQLNSEADVDIAGLEALPDEEKRDEYLRRIKDCFFEQVQRLNNRVLRPCLMPLMDARNPFDWIVMNCMYIGCCNYNSGIDKDDGDFAEERLQKMLEKMFQLKG
jgi:hypothetical protein